MRTLASHTGVLHTAGYWQRRLPMAFFIEKDGSVLGMFIRNELKEVINNRPLRNRTMGGVEGR